MAYGGAQTLAVLGPRGTSRPLLLSSPPIRAVLQRNPPKAPDGSSVPLHTSWLWRSKRKKASCDVLLSQICRGLYGVVYRVHGLTAIVGGIEEYTYFLPYVSARLVTNEPQAQAPSRSSTSDLECQGTMFLDMSI
jgi:hypothetical protein